MQEVIFREINEELKCRFEDFVEKYAENSFSPQTWRYFYAFISTAYKLPQLQRPSLSLLSEMLIEKKVENPGDYAVLYAHGLYILALYNGEKIYGEGFNP